MIDSCHKTNSWRCLMHCTHSIVHAWLFILPLRPSFCFLTTLYVNNLRMWQIWAVHTRKSINVGCIGKLIVLFIICSSGYLYYQPLDTRLISIPRTIALMNNINFIWRRLGRVECTNTPFQGHYWNWFGALNTPNWCHCINKNILQWYITWNHSTVCDIIWNGIRYDGLQDSIQIWCNHEFIHYNRSPTYYFWRNFYKTLKEDFLFKPFHYSWES